MQGDILEENERQILKTEASSFKMSLGSFFYENLFLS